MIRAFPSSLTRRYFLALTAKWERAGIGQFMRTDSRPALGCGIYHRLARHRLHSLVRSCVVSHPEKRDGRSLTGGESAALVTNHWELTVQCRFVVVARPDMTRGGAGAVGQEKVRPELAFTLRDAAMVAAVKTRQKIRALEYSTLACG